MARPGKRAPINLQEVEKLCALHCTDEEIAGWFEVSVRTIERRKKNRKFAAAMERGRARGKISIRRMQMRMLEEGNSTMGVWLGKQILGQSDHAPPQFTNVQQSIVILPAFSEQDTDVDGNDSSRLTSAMPALSAPDPPRPIIELKPRRIAQSGDPSRAP